MRSWGLASGPSLASVMSIARPMRGRTRWVATRAPRRPTSSCTLATATTSHSCSPSARKASIIT